MKGGNNPVDTAGPRSNVSKTCASKFMENKQITRAISAFIVFCSLYIVYVAVLERPLLKPFINEDKNSSIALLDDGKSGSGQEGILLLPSSSVHVKTVLSLLIMWLLSIVLGSIFEFLHLPGLLGGLVIGILCRNVEFLSQLFVVDSSWNNFLRRLALTVILTRAGIGLDWELLKRNKGLISRLGPLSAVCEAATVLLLSLFILRLSFGMSVLLALVLTATSPAVIVPTMLDLMRKDYGTKSGVSMTVMVSSTIDNIVCIVSYSIAIALVFSSVVSVYELLVQFASVVVGIGVGLIGGFCLQQFPHNAAHHVHALRVILLLSVCLAFNFGTQAIGTPSAGVVLTILTSMIASMKWKKQNQSKSYREAETFALIWEFIAVHMLFCLIGYEFEIIKITTSAIAFSLAILCIGAAVRIVSVYLLCAGSGISTRERNFVALAFCSKGTLQAALAPQIVTQSMGTEKFDEAGLILSVCVIGILVTAPIGQLILQVMGPLFLSSNRKQKREIAPSVTNIPLEISQGNPLLEQNGALHYPSQRTGDCEA